MKRNIITIDQQACTGCGLCIPNCPEGAIQIIDGKARLVSDLMCDGLGACLGHCPEGAITIEEREAESYDERKVMANIVKAGMNTVVAHLAHLRDHGQMEFLAIAEAYLKENNITINREVKKEQSMHEPHQGCPGSRSFAFNTENAPAAEQTAAQPSSLTHWPIQLHLISPQAPHFKNADMLLAADCTAFAYGSFHRDRLKGKVLAIACPKLDEGQEVYGEKIRMLIDDAKINTLTVLIMQVPCCGGLLQIAKNAAAQAQRKVPIKYAVVSIQGEIIKEEWL